MDYGFLLWDKSTGRERMWLANRSMCISLRRRSFGRDTQIAPQQPHHCSTQFPRSSRCSVAQVHCSSAWALSRTVASSRSRQSFATVSLCQFRAFTAGGAAHLAMILARAHMLHPKQPHTTCTALRIFNRHLNLPSQILAVN